MYCCILRDLPRRVITTLTVMRETWSSRAICVTVMSFSRSLARIWLGDNTLFFALDVNDCLCCWRIVNHKVNTLSSIK